MARSHDIRPRTATDMHEPTLQVRLAVLTTINEYLPDADQVELEDVYIVSYTYMLSNWKAMVSSTIQDDRYYEVTHRAGGETFVDVYHKISQRVFEADDPLHNV